MRQTQSTLEEFLGKHPTLKIINFLIENKIFDYSKKQMMEEVGISKATFFKHFKKLEQEEVVKVTRRFGKTQLYQINEDNPVVKQIIGLGLALAREALNREIHSRHATKQLLVARA